MSSCAITRAKSTACAKARSPFPVSRFPKSASQRIMEAVKNSRLRARRFGEAGRGSVYSTGQGRMCPKCDWLENDCRCSTTIGRDPPVPDRVVANLRLEKAGRGGKTVTVVYDLPRNAQFLRELCAELKRACGRGGTVSDDTVERQGDHRDRVREVLQKKACVVKG